MKLFGSLRELARILWREDGFEVSLDANSSTTYTANRDLQLPPGDVNSILVGEANTQTLTNKTIDAPSNTITNIANANISSSAAIAYSKLNLSNSIVNADINASAAIAYSKLALSNSIVNADINTSAAIDASKIADGTVSSAEFQFINSLTSNAQTQLTARVVGPASAVDNGLARFDGTSGKLIQDTPVFIDDGGIMTGLTSITIDNIHIQANTVSSTDTNGNVNIEPNGTGIVVSTRPIKSATSLILEETGAGTDTITLQAPASIAASYTLTLPTDDGISGQVLSTDGTGVLSWANSSASGGTLTTISSNYTILTADGYETIQVSTGVGVITVILPSAATNLNRRLKIVKSDTGVGRVDVNTAGSDVIANDAAGLSLYKQGDALVIRSDGGTNWILEAPYTEYASNSNSTDATTTGSGFVGGPNGSAGILGVTDLTDMRQKYVIWQMSIKPSDRFIIEMSNNQIQWYPAVGYADLGVDSYGISALTTRHDNPTAGTSQGVAMQNVDATHTSVVFGRKAVSFNGYTTGWNSYTSTFWRVRKTTGV